MAFFHNRNVASNGYEMYDPVASSSTLQHPGQVDYTVFNSIWGGGVGGGNNVSSAATVDKNEDGLFLAENRYGLAQQPKWYSPARRTMNRVPATETASNLQPIPGDCSYWRNLGWNHGGGSAYLLSRPVMSMNMGAFPLFRVDLRNSGLFINEFYRHANLLRQTDPGLWTAKAFAKKIFEDNDMKLCVLVTSQTLVPSNSQWDGQWNKIGLTPVDYARIRLLYTIGNLSYVVHIFTPPKISPVHFKLQASSRYVWNQGGFYSYVLPEIYVFGAVGSSPPKMWGQNGTTRLHDTDIIFFTSTSEGKLGNKRSKFHSKISDGKSVA